jgi:preprotein translocase subunit SecD
MWRWRVGLVLAVVLAAGGCSGEDDEPAVEQESHDLTFSIAEEATAQEVDQLVDVIESRFDALGADDATVTVEGDELYIDIESLEEVEADPIAGLLESAPELRFRPVLLQLPGEAASEGLEVTPPQEDDPGDEVVLEGRPEDEVLYQLGPSQLTGSVVEDASVQLDPGSGSWSVALMLTEDGIAEFNEVAAQCSPPSETCPTGQLAIVLDSVVQSAPTLQSPTFERDEIQISGSFTEDEAKELALALKYGSLSPLLTLVPG